MIPLEDQDQQTQRFLSHLDLRGLRHFVTRKLRARTFQEQAFPVFFGITPYLSSAPYHILATTYQNTHSTEYTQYKYYLALAPNPVCSKILNALSLKNEM